MSIAHLHTTKQSLLCSLDEGLVSACFRGFIGIQQLCRSLTIIIHDPLFIRRHYSVQKQSDSVPLKQRSANFYLTFLVLFTVLKPLIQPPSFTKCVQVETVKQCPPIARPCPVHFSKGQTQLVFVAVDDQRCVSNAVHFPDSYSSIGIFGIIAVLFVLLLCHL